jgi:hypothetical protein
MKDTIKILDIDEDSCQAKALSETDNQVHLYNIEPWIYSAFLNLKYDVEVCGDSCGECDVCINVLSFKEVHQSNKSFLW